MAETTLVAGATGMPGSRIAHHLLVLGLAVSSCSFTRHSHGTITDLEATIARQRAADPDAIEALGNTYILDMLNGRTALADPQNDRYPDLRPETYVQHVERTWEQTR